MFPPKQLPHLGLLATLLLAAPAWGSELHRLTCMAPIGGQLVEPQVYLLKEDGTLYLNGRPISSFKGMELSTVTTDQGTETSTASHEWLAPGKTLQRRVFWLSDKGRKKPGLVSILDFARQRLMEDGQDICHHERYLPATDRPQAGNRGSSAPH